MKQNDTSKLQQLLGSKKTIERVAKSPDAKALAQMLTKGRDETSLKQAAEKAAKGDTSQLSEIIQSVMSSPGGAELIQRLNGVIDQK
ncbi:MAG: hypothetical protein HFF78_04560 [Oscillospiraceae bacterium]|nr:hypothetical protein [Oscillospiraceae bacterium]